MKRNEIIFTALVLVIMSVFAYFNLQKAQVLARDIQRKNDLKHIATALTAYLKDVGTYPPARDGKIDACLEGDSFRPCSWGKDALESTTSAYIKPLPEDPLTPKGTYSYLYVSNVRDYQLFASLERRDDDEYNLAVFKRNLLCGKMICNFGVSDGKDAAVENELPAIDKK